MAAAAILIVGTTVSSVGSTMSQAATKRQGYARSEQFEARLSAEAASAKAIYTPAVAVDGGANCSAGKCREIDLMAGTTTTSGQHAAFVAYLATATGGVQRYTYTETVANSAPQGLLADGAAIAGNSLYFRDVPVTALATDADATPTTKAQLTALAITPHRWTFQYEHAGVLASNDVFYVHYDPGTGADVFPVSVRVKPITSLTVNNGTYTAPAAPPMDYTGQSGSLVFPYPSAAAQAFTVHELRYHDAFSTSGGCLLGGATITSASPNSQLPNPNPMSPPDQDSGPATFNATPAQAGTCTQLVKDVYGQTLGESMQVMGALGIAGNSMIFTTPSDPAQSDSASKSYDNTAIALSFSGCAGIATATAGAQTVPGAVNASSATTAFTVSPVAYGSCTLTVTDQYGEAQNVAITVYAAPLWQLNVTAPNPSSLTTNGSSATFTASAPLINGSQVRPPAPGPLQVQATNQSAPGVCSSSPAGWTASGATFTVSPGSVSATCTIALQANGSAANSPQSVTVVITNGVNPPPATPTPTPQPTQICTLDSYGYCVDQVSQTAKPPKVASSCDNGSGSTITLFYLNGTQDTIYNLFGTSGYIGQFDETATYFYSGDPCSPSDQTITWNPYDPSTTYGDPNIP